MRFIPGNASSAPRCDDSRPLTIGFYTPDLPDSGSPNGIVTYTRNICEALRSLGHSVIVVTDRAIQRADGTTSTFSKWGASEARLRSWLEGRRRDHGPYAWGRVQILRAFNAARRHGVQIFEIEESFGLAGRLVGYGIPIVERLHGPHVLGREPIETAEERLSGDARVAAEIASMHKVQAITCPSRTMLNEMVRRYDLAPPVSAVIPNPIQVVPRNSVWEVHNARTEQLLCVGRIDLRKGADIVMGAFALALERRPSLSLILAGPDSGIKQEDGTSLNFETFVRQTLPDRARSRIHFLGPQSPARLAELRLQSAFAVIGSRFENFAYSIAEAMACGMPVLATNSFGNGEMIRDGLDGRIVPVNDINAMADAMTTMSSDLNKLAAMGHSTYDRAKSWLNPDRIARETEAIYRRTMPTCGNRRLGG